MAEQLQITFRHMAASDSLRMLATEKLQKLRTRYPDAFDCHVVVDRGSVARHRKGNEYMARVELTVGREHVRLAAEASHEDAHAGVRDVFDIIRRQVEHRIERHTA